MITFAKIRGTNRSPKRQAGVAAVEFALISAAFFTLLIGIMEMGRLLWTWNAAVEATRMGARVAAVCTMNDSEIVARMITMLPSLSSSNVTVSYIDPGNASCTVNTCKEVSVSLQGYQHQTIIPFVPLSVTLPPFQTTLPREYMNTTGAYPCS